MFKSLIRTALLFTILAVWFVPAEAVAERRVALVIGNGAYKNTIELPNAPNDARAVSQALRRLNFDVVEGVELTGAGMTEKLKEFSRLLTGAEVGMFYYAGHGLQVGGENYLVPIDATLKQERDLDFETLKVDLVLKQILRESKVSLVILDACRDNPLSQELARSMSGSGRSRSLAIGSGLGAIDTSGASGAMIAFATAPGTVALDGTGRHSPFTEALLAHMETPGLDINVMMTRVRGQVVRATNERQKPWTNVSLTSEFQLNPAGGAAPTGTVSVAALPSGEGSQPRGLSGGGFDPRQLELQLWQDARGTNSVGAYQAYLSQFPSGIYAAMAKESIARLSGNAPSIQARAPAPAAAPPAPIGAEARAAEATEAIEEALSIDKEQWRTVQRRLSRLGFNTKGVDGEAGRGTRQAIRDWQTARGLRTSGYFNKQQFEHLMAEPLPAPVANEAAEEPETPRRTRSTNSSGSSSGSTQSSSSSGSGTRRTGGNGGIEAGAAAEAAGRFIGGLVKGRIGF